MTPTLTRLSTTSWKTRAALAAVLFFTAKGLGWLALAAVMCWGAVR